MKTCSGCREAKPLEAFTTSRRTKDGREPRCKICRNAYEKARYQRNAEQERPRKREASRRRYRTNPQAVQAAAQRWRDRNPKRVQEIQEEWRAANPGYHRDWYWKNAEKERARSREVMRRDRAEHPERERERRRRYRETNLETVRKRERENTHRRRALKEGTSNALAEFMAQLVTEPCAYCGSTENITVDHVVPLSRGGEHESANLAPACYSCNASKGSKLLSEWPGRLVA